jgi:hypothetical protein
VRDDVEYPWVSLGDPYAAGPGAGNAYSDLPNECFRNDGAYLPQLNDDFLFPKPVMQFLACTSHTVDDMISLQVPEMDEDQMVVTMSIGGNNLGFGKILKVYIFKPGGPISADCDETIEEARNYIYYEPEGQLHKGYDAGFCHFEKIPNDHRRIMLVQLYPAFFNDETNRCDNQTWAYSLAIGYSSLKTSDTSSID